MKGKPLIYLGVVVFLAWTLVTPAYGGSVPAPLSDAEMGEIQAGRIVLLDDGLSPDDDTVYAGVILWDEAAPRNRGAVHYVSGEGSQVGNGSNTAFGGSRNGSILQRNITTNGTSF